MLLLSQVCSDVDQGVDRPCSPSSCRMSFINTTGFKVAQNSRMVPCSHYGDNRLDVTNHF